VNYLTFETEQSSGQKQNHFEERKYRLNSPKDESEREGDEQKQWNQDQRGQRERPGENQQQKE